MCISQLSERMPLRLTHAFYLATVTATDLQGKLGELHCVALCLMLSDSFLNGVRKCLPFYILNNFIEDDDGLWNFELWCCKTRLLVAGETSGL